MPESNRYEHVYFVGIAGVGMSALAQIMAARGVRVSGSDPHQNEATTRLERVGATINTNQAAANIADARPDLVVATAAVTSEHPEVAAAKELEIPVVSRAEFLGNLMAELAGPRIAVTGTHGKTTTTSMTAAVLLKGGLDPTVLVGGEFEGIGGNVRVGGDVIVAEACEAYDSFLSLRPDIAVLTNVDADHLDYYGSVERIHQSFIKFLSGVSTEGLVIWCGDDEGARSVVAAAGDSLTSRSMSYGIAESSGNSLWAVELQTTRCGSRFKVKVKNHETVRNLGELELQVPGDHNVLNALAAVAVGNHLGVAWESIAAALADFRGADRRFDIRGEKDGVLVIDDYAHHPTEVRATILGARAAFAGRRIISAFQPHLYSRTRDFMSEFADALLESDAILVTDIYAAREKPIPGVRASDLVRVIASRDYEKTVMYVPDKHKIAGVLHWIARPGDIVLTMGAGDVNEAAEEFLHARSAAA